MRRWRLAVALIPPAGLAAEIDVLRRALGDPSLERHGPHLTLVPPINVAVADMATVLAVLRAAAARTEPFELSVGPVTSFDPRTPTIHLAVGGALDALEELRDAVFQPPLTRKAWPFQPHVTLREHAPLHLIRAARTALRAYSAPWPVERVVLLARSSERPHGRPWQPVADVILGAVRLVGLGGIPTELAQGTLVDPEAREQFGEVPLAVEPPVVVARRDGEVVGVAWVGGSVGRTADDADLAAGEVARS